MENNREQVLENLKEIFVKYRQRQKNLKSLVEVKKNKELAIWMPQREKEVFKSINPIDFNEVKVLSILIETQMNSICEEYPEWSKKVHLQKINGTKWESINPVFVMAFNIEAFNELNLKPYFLESLNI